MYVQYRTTVHSDTLCTSSVRKIPCEIWRYGDIHSDLQCVGPSDLEVD